MTYFKTINLDYLESFDLILRIISNETHFFPLFLIFFELDTPDLNFYKVMLTKAGSIPIGFHDFLLGKILLQVFFIASILFFFRV